MNNSGWNNDPKQAAWAPPAQQPWPVANKLQAPVKQAEPDTSKYDAMTQDQVLMEHQKVKSELEALKEKELEIRKYIAKRAFPDGKEGMNTAELGNGYQLKVGLKFNYTLDPDLDKVENVLDEIEKCGNEGPFLAERLVSWKANFLVSEYRALCEPTATDNQKKIKALIDSVLTITEATPTVEIKEPKAKK